MLCLPSLFCSSFSVYLLFYPSSGGAAVKVPRTEDSTAAGDDSQQNSAFANANRALQAMQAASGTTQQPYGYGAQQQQQPWMQIQYATTGQAATAVS